MHILQYSLEERLIFFHATVPYLLKMMRKMMIITVLIIVDNIYITHYFSNDSTAKGVGVSSICTVPLKSSKTAFIRLRAAIPVAILPHSACIAS